MRVSDLAKEFGIKNEEVLAALKSMKLKAKDGKQELSSAVLAVIRRALIDSGKTPKPVAESSVKAKTEAVKKVAKKKEISRKKQAPKAKKTAKPKDQKEFKKKTVTAKRKTAKAAKEKTLRKTPAKKVKTREPKKPSNIETVIVKETKKPIKTPRPKAEQKSTAGKGLRPAVPAQKKEAEQKKAETPLPKEEKPKGPLTEIEVQVPITVKDLAVRIQEKPSIVLKELMKMGIFAHINQGLDEDIIRKILEKFGFSLSKIKTKEEQIIEFHDVEEDDPSVLKARAPVITFMGHVDHGKTSLLDKIRKSKLTDQEHGGITQHIGAYSVDLPKGRITFLDTPGHEAFTAMRARGAHITDLVILVIAADEGIMPQTDEAIDHARAANVPIVVALNKMDRRNADPDRVKKQLAERGLNPEDWGGHTIVVGVSAVTGEGIDTLLEMILLESELLELKANYGKRASGIIVEAKMTHGKGAVASVIVQNGTLREGDIVIAGPHYCRIKAMFDDHERPIKEAGPAMAAEILGLSGVPEAGEKFYVVEDEKQAREIAAQRQNALRDQKLQKTGKITLEDLYAQIKSGSIKELPIILKADVQGSLEALKDNLAKISNPDVQLKIIHTGIGVINASDVILAGASDAIIIGFNVDVGPRAKDELEKQAVDVRTYRIIYDAIKDIRSALEGLLEPKIKKNFLGRIEVRQVFKLSRAGIVAGCFVQKGRAHRKAKADVVRNGEVVYSGAISSLKRFKDDVREVKEGFECGVTVDGFTDIQPGDIIEAYELEKIARTL